MQRSRPQVPVMKIFCGGGKLLCGERVIIMAKRINLLPAGGTFYKANLHSHTVYSDGKLTPEESKNVYQEQGYSVVAYTDHRKYRWHEELMDSSFVALAAYEVDMNEHEKVPGDFSRVKTYHINLYDVNPKENRLQKEESLLPKRRYGDYHYLNEYIEQMKSLGFFACYNHPYWSLQNYDDFKNLRGFWGMEIYNYGCEHDGLYGYNPQSYDEMLRLGNRLFCVAADDNHNVYPFGDPLCDSFGGFTMIKAEKLTYEAVTEALLNGNFYSSMGPEILELYVEEGVLYVKTGPVEKIFVVTEGRGCHKKLANPGETITEAKFPLDGNEGYIRVTCRDGRGLHADSNAYVMHGKEPQLFVYNMQ